MDLQVKLASDGNAVAYASPEIPSLPKWAVWENKAFGTTYEPITFVYNKRLVPAADVPADHTALLTLLRRKPMPTRARSRPMIRRSPASAFCSSTRTRRTSRRPSISSAPSEGQHQALHLGGRDDRACDLGRAHHRLRHFRLLCARPFEEGAEPRHRDAEGLSLVASRVAFISTKAKNPNAAKLFLDYLLSKRAQTIVANAAELYSLRDDVQGEATVKKVSELVGDKARPIPIGPELLTNLDEGKRFDFLKRWQAAMKGQ